MRRTIRVSDYKSRLKGARCAVMSLTARGWIVECRYPDGWLLVKPHLEDEESKRLLALF